MYTKQQEVKGRVYVWAVPADSTALKEGKEPFTYEISENKSYHWRSGAVMIHDQEVTVALPGGISLLEKAIDTLHKAKEDLQSSHNIAMKELDERIAGLLMIAHKPPADESVVHHQPPSDPVHTETIVDILVRRDGMDRSEAEDMVAEARERVANGENPEEILHDDFGLEPDFVFELL